MFFLLLVVAGKSQLLLQSAGVGDTQHFGQTLRGGTPDWGVWKSDIGA